MINEKGIVDKYLGIPYVHSGRDMTGLDCWGLVLNIYNDIGIKVFDLESYDRDWVKKGENYFVEHYYKAWKEQEMPAFLDVILIKDYEGTPFHAGVCLDRSRFIHGSHLGVVVTRVGERLSKRIHGYFRHEDIGKALK